MTKTLKQDYIHDKQISTLTRNGCLSLVSFIMILILTISFSLAALGVPVTVLIFVVGVMSIGDKWVDFSCRSFAPAEENWSVQFATVQQVELRFDEAGIMLPVTQQEIPLFQSI